MRLQALQKLIRWDQFDSVVNLLQGFGWAVLENVDGPDVRIASFVLDGHILWLFFDDLMGGYLKTEEITLDLKTIEAKIDVFL